MRVLWIGFGQAGGKIANSLVGMNRRIYSAIAINTEEADLSGLQNIREKVLIGKYALRGRGVGSDIDLGASIAEKSLAQMMDSIDVSVRKRDPEAIWIAAGLGGGTGAGGSFVLANELRNIYKHIPVYGIGVVPSVTGMPNDKEALNLSNTIKSFELWMHYFNNILLVDNQQYEQRQMTRESVEKMFQRVNDRVAHSLNTIISAGEVRPPAQEVFSSSEIKATLGLIGDISTIGYCAEEIKLKSRSGARRWTPAPMIWKTSSKGALRRALSPFQRTRRGPGRHRWSFTADRTTCSPKRYPRARPNWKS